MSVDIKPDVVLDFWFAEGMEDKWFFADGAFDQIVRDQFLDIHTKATAGELDHWRETREGRLSLIIILDQFSRNIYRGSGKAFDADHTALELARRALRMGDDIWFKKNKPDGWRAFIYVVFMHSEHVEDQRRCLDLYLTHGPEFSIPFARDHLDVICRFGRFPNRNEALERKSTPEEEEFLSVGGIGWGK